MRLRQTPVHYLVGRRNELPSDPLGATTLRFLVPDILERDVFVCGPTGMNEHVRRSLRALSVPAGQIHVERFAY